MAFDKVFNPASQQWEQPRFNVSYSARGYGNNDHCATREQADEKFAKELAQFDRMPKFEAVEVAELAPTVLRRVHIVHRNTRRVWHVIQMTEL
jgi:hypothetical protein